MLDTLNKIKCNHIVRLEKLIDKMDENNCLSSFEFIDGEIYKVLTGEYLPLKTDIIKLFNDFDGSFEHYNESNRIRKKLIIEADWQHETYMKEFAEHEHKLRLSQEMGIHVKDTRMRIGNDEMNARHNISTAVLHLLPIRNVKLDLGVVKSQMKAYVKHLYQSWYYYAKSTGIYDIKE